MTNGFIFVTGHEDHSIKAPRKTSTPEQLMASYSQEIEAIERKKLKLEARIADLERKMEELRHKREE